MTESDLPKVKEICDKFQDFPFPDDPMIAGVVEDNGVLIGAGVVRRIYETIVSLDLSANKRDRVKAFRLLVEYGLAKSYQQGVDEWHAFVTDPSLIKTLKNSFGFKECKGLPLMLYFGE